MWQGDVQLLNRFGILKAFRGSLAAHLAPQLKTLVVDRFSTNVLYFDKLFPMSTYYELKLSIAYTCI
jgi:hypothetical protein